MQLGICGARGQHELRSGSPLGALATRVPPALPVCGRRAAPCASTATRAAAAGAAGAGGWEGIWRKDGDAGGLAQRSSWVGRWRGVLVALLAAEDRHEPRPIGAPGLSHGQERHANRQGDDQDGAEQAARAGARARSEITSVAGTMPPATLLAWPWLGTRQAWRWERKRMLPRPARPGGRPRPQGAPPAAYAPPASSVFTSAAVQGGAVVH